MLKTFRKKLREWFTRFQIVRKTRYAGTSSKDPDKAFRIHRTSSGDRTTTRPRACNLKSGFTNPTIVGVRRELLSPKEASDVYDRRLDQRYFVYQVRVAHLSKDL